MLPVGALIENSRGDIRLEESGTDSEHVKTESKWTDGSTVLDELGNGGDDHDNMCNTTNCDTNADCLESAQVLISEPSTENWQTIGEESESISHGRGDDRSLSQSASTCVRW